MLALFVALLADLRALIRQMQAANPLWGAPRVHGELQKLGITIAQTTVAKHLGRRPLTPPSQTWRTFLANHISQLASIDFFTVPTATFRVLLVFIVLSQDRRRIVHVNVTAQPTAPWTAQQLREAWPWDSAPRFVIRDRDAIDGWDVRRTAGAMDIDEVLTAPRAPWQNPFVARVTGSIRRECLDHLIVAHLGGGYSEPSMMRSVAPAESCGWCNSISEGAMPSSHSPPATG